jgi:hypothetical protein
MYTTESKIYQLIAGLLLDEIGCKEFFSGSVTCHDNDIELRLVCTLVIRRKNHHANIIENITPVWWTLTTTLGGEQLANDFSFNELKHHIFD